jgi:putative membrane protein
MDRSDELAIERTRLALERTLLGWLRTALSLVSFGFVIDRGFQLAEKYGREPASPTVLGPAEVALAMILLGLFALGAGIVQHRMGLTALVAQGARPRPSGGGLVAFGCAVISVLALLSVFLG